MMDVTDTLTNTELEGTVAGKENELIVGSLTKDSLNLNTPVKNDDDSNSSRAAAPLSSLTYDEDRLHHQEGADLLLSLAETASQHAKIHQRFHFDQFDQPKQDTQQEHRMNVGNYVAEASSTLVSSSMITSGETKGNRDCGDCASRLITRIDGESTHTALPLQTGMTLCTDGQDDGCRLRNTALDISGVHDIDNLRFHSSPIQTNSDHHTDAQGTSAIPVMESHVPYPPRGMVPIMWSPTCVYGRPSMKAAVPVTEDKALPPDNLHQQALYDSMCSSPLSHQNTGKRPHPNTEDVTADTTSSNDMESKKTRIANDILKNSSESDNVATSVNKCETISILPSTLTTTFTDGNGNIIISPSSSNERTDDSDDQNSSSSTCEPMHLDTKRAQKQVEDAGCNRSNLSSKHQQPLPSQYSTPHGPQQQTHLSYPTHPNTLVPYYHPSTSGHTPHVNGFMYIPPHHHYGSSATPIGGASPGFVAGMSPYGHPYRYPSHLGPHPFMQQHPAGYYGYNTPVGFASNGVRLAGMQPLSYDQSGKPIYPSPHMPMYAASSTMPLSAPKANIKVSTSSSTKNVMSSSLSSLIDASQVRSRNESSRTEISSPLIECRKPSETCDEKERDHHNLEVVQSSSPPSASKASTTKCVRLVKPVSSRHMWSDSNDYDSIKIPDFMRLVNFPDYLSRGRTGSNRNSKNSDCGDSTIIEGMKHCVMCGKLRVCSASGVVSNSISSKKSNTGVVNENCSIIDNNDDGATSESTSSTHIIPRQNKGVCTSCDVAVWVIVQEDDPNAEQIEIKWCKGCKNFRPWVSFGEKGLATKCVRCRTRQKEKYANQKKESTSAASSNILSSTANRVSDSWSDLDSSRKQKSHGIGNSKGGMASRFLCGNVEV